MSPIMQASALAVSALHEVTTSRGPLAPTAGKDVATIGARSNSWSNTRLKANGLTPPKGAVVLDRKSGRPGSPPPPNTLGILQGAPTATFDPASDPTADPTANRKTPLPRAGPMRAPPGESTKFTQIGGPSHTSGKAPFSPLRGPREDTCNEITQGALCRMPRLQPPRRAPQGHNQMAARDGASTRWRGSLGLCARRQPPLPSRAPGPGFGNGGARPPPLLWRDNEKRVARALRRYPPTDSRRGYGGKVRPHHRMRNGFTATERSLGSWAA